MKKAKISFTKLLKQAKKDCGIEVHLTPTNEHKLTEQQWVALYRRVLELSRDAMQIGVGDEINLARLRAHYLNRDYHTSRLRNMCWTAWNHLVINEIKIK